MNIRHIALSGALISCALTGCVSPSFSTIEGTDRGVSIPSMRVSWQKSGNDDARVAASEPRDGFALEFEWQAASASDTQSLAAGQNPILFKDTTFSAPQDLTHDFDFTFLNLSGRWRAFGNKSVGFELLAGIGYPTLDLTVSSAAGHVDDSLNFWGLSLGVGGIWIMRPGTSLQARFMAFSSISTSDGYLFDLDHLEVYLAQALGNNVSIRAGYAGWKIKGEGDNRSDLDFEFSGPSLGLNFDF
jgi:hypothetical protein